MTFDMAHTTLITDIAILTQSFLALGIDNVWRILTKKMTLWVNKCMSNRGDCWAAPAKPGLLIIDQLEKVLYSCLQNQYLNKMFFSVSFSRQLFISVYISLTGTPPLTQPPKESLNKS